MNSDHTNLNFGIKREEITSVFNQWFVVYVKMKSFRSIYTRVRH